MSFDRGATHPVSPSSVPESPLSSDSSWGGRKAVALSARSDCGVDASLAPLSILVFRSSGTAGAISSSVVALRTEAWGVAPSVADALAGAMVCPSSGRRTGRPTPLSSVSDPSLLSGSSRIIWEPATPPVCSGVGSCSSPVHLSVSACLSSGTAGAESPVHVVPACSQVQFLCSYPPKT